MNNIIKKQHCENNNNQRLNKFIAASGLCSRRRADELVFMGRVTVNGQIETSPGRRVSDADNIEVDGQPLRSRPAPLYIMLNKPVQVVCTMSDPQGRKTVPDLLPASLRARGLFPVGRLDYFSEGLFLLTNDGAWAERLAHPRYEKEKEYEVILRERPSPHMLAAMRQGMTLEDGARLLPVKVSEHPLPEGGALLKMVLRQGLNRQIRRMCAAFGLTILKLRRVRVGHLRLGDLRTGAWRELTGEEVAAF